MATIDLPHLRQWIGRVRTDHDTAALRHARLMAATLDRAGDLQAGDALPPLWHWIYFLEGLAPSELGRDGHPARGGFLPPVPLPNRLWAGGRVSFEAPIPLGAPVEKRSQVLAVDHKRGRRGDLVFVTVLHEVFTAGARAVREEHDIVYRAPAPPPAAPTPAAPAAATATTAVAAPTHERRWRPDSTQLFRYSALTFNGHRIHYDADYCRDVEGYPNLVVHGPLVATQLAALAGEAAAAHGATLRHFDYRALHPALLGDALVLETWADAAGAELLARVDGGAAVMRAQARWV